MALLRVHWALSVFAGISGIIGAAAYLLHFRSLEYTLENGCIVIRKGILIRSRREIPRAGILMIQSVTVFGYVLFTSIKTAGGTAVLFCDADLPEINNKSVYS